jgi:hypothetical protein
MSMRSRTRPALTVWAFVLLLSACASPRPASVPDALKVAANESLTLVAAAKGVQIYECRAGKEAGAADEWAFVAPEAELFDARGSRIGDHGAGPYWQALDGSRTLGTPKARADAPNGDAIPWLLMSARPAGATGSLSGTTSVQRINTVGGKAPATGCSRSNYGAIVRVPYSADYHFYAAR